MKLLIATTSEGKLREFRALFGDLPFELTSLTGEGIRGDVPETGTTFQENAVQKARAYAKRSGMLTLAEDSGLEVDALNGEPGVYSARFGGDGLSDADRVDLLLERLKGVPRERRTARFRSVIALVDPGQEPVVVEGTVEGIIGTAPRGKGGFGYDPVFLLPDRDITTAELPMDEKNRISHRGQSARKAAEVLRSMAGSRNPSR